MDKRRHLLPKINALLKLFPCVAIIGPRQCGKSTLAKMVTNDSWSYYDLERPDDYQLITGDPQGFFKRKTDKVIIDEAQQYPELFAILRSVIDEDRNAVGRYILTGSSSHEIVKGLSESLAGRIATIELATFKTSEFYETDLSPFYSIFTDNKLEQKSLINLKPCLSLNQVYEHWFHGGYPEPRIKGQQTPEFYGLWKDQYFNDYIKRDVASLFPKISSHNFRLFLQTLTFHSGTSINNSSISRALEVSSVTVKDYLEIIHDTFIWRNIRSYENNALKKVQKMPRGFFRDSGILHHLLKINSIDQLLVHPQAGLSFESFVIEEIIRGIQSQLVSATDFYFYRTIDKSEIDLIIEGPFGILPVEVKLGYKVSKKQLRALENFIKETSASFGILVNSSDKVEMLTDSIVQIPVGCL